MKYKIKTEEMIVRTYEVEAEDFKSAINELKENLDSKTGFRKTVHLAEHSRSREKLLFPKNLKEKWLKRRLEEDFK